MIKTVKDDVFERLRLKRLSADAYLQLIQSDELLATDMKSFMRLKKKKEQSEQFLHDQFQFVDLLQKFEERDPKAFNVFIEQAKKRGIYKGVK